MIKIWVKARRVLGPTTSLNVSWNLNLSVLYVARQSQKFHLWILNFALVVVQEKEYWRGQNTICLIFVRYKQVKFYKVANLIHKRYSTFSKGALLLNRYMELSIVYLCLGNSALKFGITQRLIMNIHASNELRQPGLKFCFVSQRLCWKRNTQRWSSLYHLHNCHHDSLLSQTFWL